MTSTMNAAAFAEEAAALLDELDYALVDLREEATDTEVLAMTVRVLHTLNGAGRLFGFHTMAALAAGLETQFVPALRDGTPVPDALLDEAALVCARMRADMASGSSGQGAGPIMGVDAKTPGS